MPFLKLIFNSLISLGKQSFSCLQAESEIIVQKANLSKVPYQRNYMHRMITPTDQEILS